MAFATAPDGARIAYQAVGSGPPLLLIMGYGLPGSAWALALPYFTSHFQVVYFDNRGTGASKEAEPGPFREFIPTAAGDAIAVMEALGWESAHVFGISMGGMIAQELGLSAPERVRSLVLGCTTCGEPPPTPAQLEATRQLEAGVRLMQSDPDAAARLTLPLSLPQAYLDAHPEVFALSAMAFRAAPTLSLPSVAEGEAVAWSSAGRVEALASPVLVLHGTEDRLIPVTHAHELFARLPQAELRLLKGAGHTFMAQDPAGTMNGIADWLLAREAEHAAKK